MFSRKPNIPIEKQSVRNLQIVLFFAPIVCIPLGIIFGWAAISLSLKWKSIVCGLASLWMFYMAFGVIYKVRRELKRRKTSKL
jgi:hypothetical protein